MTSQPRPQMIPPHESCRWAVMQGPTGTVYAAAVHGVEVEQDDRALVSMCWSANGFGPPALHQVLSFHPTLRSAQEDVTRRMRVRA